MLISSLLRLNIISVLIFPPVPYLYLIYLNKLKYLIWVYKYLLILIIFILKYVLINILFF